MAAKGKRPMRALTASDKIEAIQRVNDGESKASVARDIGVPESTLRGWCKNEDKLRYMSTRHSTPDTDKSSDAEQPPEKRARASPVSQPSASPEAGLDLSAATAPQTHSIQPPQQVDSEPIELTKPKTEPPPPPPPPPPEPRSSKPDATSVSMSAISPLSGLHPLSGHLGVSFNDIAANLSLIAQLNPGLGALNSLGPGAAKTLRAVRSPKPSQATTLSTATPLNLSDKYKGSKHEYQERKSKNHHKEPAPVDDALWYWLKTQQAMLDLTSHNALPAAAPASRTSPHRGSPKPAAPIPPLASSLDLNKNTWFWQYYKQFGGAMPPPDDKVRSAAPVPSAKSENILYSQLTKERERAWGNERTETPAPAPPAKPEETREKPEVATQQEKPEAAHEGDKRKARTVLDNLLFNNNNVSEDGAEDACCNSENEFDGAVAEALEHGDKLLAWLETCRDPSVTRMHVHQLRALLGNIRARAQRRPPAPADRVSRRK